MTTPIEEMKIRAKLLLKALDAGEQGAQQRAAAIARRRRWEGTPDWTLARCLNIVAAELGFHHWEHARRVLGGEAQAEEDFGSFWYDERCSVLLNHWYAGYAQALESHRKHAGSFLLPYAKQFVVVQAPYVATLGVPAESPAWMAGGHDLVQAYGSPAWQELAMQRLQASRKAH